MPSRTEGNLVELVTSAYGEQSWWFWCEPCDTHHSFRVKNCDPKKLPEGLTPEWRKRYLNGPIWTFVNNDPKRPTFKPSLLCRHPDHKKCLLPGDTYCKKEGCKGETYVCHSFVTDGMIRYLNDCTHDLAGKTVPVHPPRF